MNADSLRLIARGKFYIDERCDPQRIGPKLLMIEGKRYHRFMDFIYTPTPPSTLPFDDVAALCELRLEFAETIIDRGVHRAVVECIANRVKSSNPDAVRKRAIEILDFGCGTGLASEEFRSAWGAACNVTGLDVSERAVATACSRGVHAYLTTREGEFPFQANAFDLVMAIFVFHFQVPESRFQEILRVLRPNGLLAFNLYGDVPSSLWRNLERVGFEIINGKGECNLPESHQIYLARPKRHSRRCS
jgi:SAM-dependent methyltransferase